MAAYYITKYAFNMEHFPVDGEIVEYDDEDNDDEWVALQSRRGFEWHKTRKEAASAGNEMVRKKMLVLRDKIEQLERAQEMLREVMGSK